MFDMECDCFAEDAPPEFLLPPPPIPPFLRIDENVLCGSNAGINKDMCSRLMFLESSSISSRVSTIIAIIIGVLVVFAILGLLIYAKCRQNNFFKKLRLQKSQNTAINQCVYTKNNNTNISNYYEDIHEVYMNSMPTYHRTIIIKPADVHYPQGRNLHQITCRQPAFATDKSNCQNNCGPIYEELDQKNTYGDSEDDFAEDELSSVDYKYTKPSKSYYNSETLPLNNSERYYTIQKPRDNLSNIPNDCWSHVKTFQNQNKFRISRNNSENVTEDVTSDLECGTSDVSEKSNKMRENHFHCDHKVNKMIEFKYLTNDYHIRVNDYHRSEDQVFKTPKKICENQLDTDKKRSRISILNENDIKVGWKRGILLPDPNLRSIHPNDTNSLPYIISRSDRYSRRPPIIINSELTQIRRANSNIHPQYFDRSKLDLTHVQDSSFGSDSGYSNRTQSSYIRNIK